MGLWHDISGSGLGYKASLCLRQPHDAMFILSYFYSKRDPTAVKVVKNLNTYHPLLFSENTFKTTLSL